MDIRNDIKSGIINRTSFGGFKNILANEVFFSDNKKLSYLGIELNNAGKQDLQKWREIQKEIKPYEPQMDFLLLSHFDINKDESAYIINGYNASLSPSICTIKSKEEESSILSFYTFFADLAKRICKTAILPKNNGYFDNIISNSVQQLVDIGFDKANAIDIVSVSIANSPNEIKESVKSIADDIHESVIEYLA